MQKPFPLTLAAILAATLVAALAACRPAADDPTTPPPPAPATPATPPTPSIAFADAFPSQPPFDRPLFVAFHDTDPGHAYVVTQPGQVFRVPRDPAAKERELFLDLGEHVYTENWEEGLLGFAFDPGYAENGHVYACWSERTDERKAMMAGGVERTCTRQSVIARYRAGERAGEQAGKPVVDLASELRVLEVAQPFGNHNGGTILFGPDGMLYIALGDGGAANDPFTNAESLDTLLGKVLRIDVCAATTAAPYAVPPDNPFVGQDGARGEIWAYGLRNVWRMAFDRATGELWCGDVGQNRVEEVDRLVKGGCYGWNSFEGSEVFGKRASKAPRRSDPIRPVAEYSHELGLSITGGHVYRKSRIAGLAGHFVYADFVTRRIWACRTEAERGRHRVSELGLVPAPPSSFAEEPEGELLVTCFGEAGGRVLRLVPGPGR